MTQVRKDAIELYYSAIDESMVDLNVRRVTFWYWHCRAITSRLLVRSLWPPQTYRRPNQRPRRRELVIVRDSIASLYDTLGKVAVDPRVLERIHNTPAARWQTAPASQPEASASIGTRRRRGPRVRGGGGAPDTTNPV